MIHEYYISNAMFKYIYDHVIVLSFFVTGFISENISEIPEPISSGHDFFYWLGVVSLCCGAAYSVTGAILNIIKTIKERKNK